MAEEDRRTAADTAMADAVMAAADEDVAAHVLAYYHDEDRAERTPRGTMYLHIGLLCGLLLRLQARMRALERVVWALDGGVDETVGKES